MDQIKVIIKKLRKFGFWVLAGLCLVLILAFWQMMASSLASQFDAKKKKIESSMNEMQTLANQADLPNESVVRQTKRAIKLQSENVYASWEVFYKHQKETNKWSAIEDPKFQPDFATAGERRYQSGRYHTILEAAREYYRDNIQEYLTKLKADFDIKRPDPAALRKLAGSEDAAADMDLTMMSGDRLRNDQLLGKVFWNEQNFRLLRSKLRWRSVPNTEQVIVAQEDLWVYEALLRAVAETNEGSSDFNVPIKEIVGIEVAQDAVNTIEKTSERIIDLKALEAFAKSVGMEGSSSSSAATAIGEMPPTSTEEQLSAADKLTILLYDNRYVDRDGKPLTAQQMKDNPPAVEYKLLPIRMSVVINQRAIAALLVNCMNSHMPIEIQQCAINPGQGRKFSFVEEDPLENRPTGSRPQDRSDYARPEAEELDLSRQRGNTQYLSVLGPEDVELEITGMVYVFNPPDITKFPSLAELRAAESATKEGEEVEEEGAEPAAAPVARTSTPMAREPEPAEEEPADTDAEPADTEETPARPAAGTAAEEPLDEELPADEELPEPGAGALDEEEMPEE